MAFPLLQALKGAQANGYAEQNPAADVEGQDTCRKLCILSSIAFGWHLLPEQVPTTGITSITLADEAYADACQRRIKLLGRAIAREDGTVCAYVEPHFISLQNPLAGVDDVFNAILVKGDATGDVMFYGRGAGKLPTASAVVADVIAAARQLERASYRPWQPNRPSSVVSSDQLGQPVVCPIGGGHLFWRASDHFRREGRGERLDHACNDPSTAGPDVGR